MFAGPTRRPRGHAGSSSLLAGVVTGIGPACCDEGMMAISWQQPFRELNPKVEKLVVKVLEEGKGAGKSPDWQTLGSVTQLDCHNPLCQRGGVDLQHTLREMVATRRAELENVKMCRGIEGDKPSVAPRRCLNRFAFRISLVYRAEGDR